MEPPQVYAVCLLPATAVLLAGSVMRGAAYGSGVGVFASGIGIFLLCFAGLGVSLFPNIVQPDTTVYPVAGHSESLVFKLAGVAILLPLILGYTIFAYRMFSGRLTGEEAYE